MSDLELTYANMAEKLPQALPELKQRFDAELAWLSKKDSAYMIYEFVLYKHMAVLLARESENKPALERAFGFLESLLTHVDARVRDVVDQSVCEAICSDEVVLQKAQRYMGPAAKKACADYLGQKPQ